MLVLTPAFHPNAGGVQMSTFKLARWFRDAGHQVGVFSFARAGHVETKLVELFQAEEVDGQKSRRNRAMLTEALNRFAPDIVINQMPYEHDIGKVLRQWNPRLLLGCLRNTLFSVRNNVDAYGARVLPRGVSVLLRNRPGRRLLLERHRARHRRDLERILDTYDRFVLFGPPNLGELRFFVPGFDEGRTWLIPNSIPSVLEEVPKKERRLLWLGRVNVDQKRADLILPLWERIQPALPDWSFDVVGEGPALEALQRQAADRGLRNVEFHGQQSPDAFYRRAAVFVMTSAFEGFPNTLIEAQSYGAVPVIFNSYPMAEWVLQVGRGGVLVEPFDIDAMAREVIEVARSGRQAELAEQALENARRFHIDAVGAMWQDLFDAHLRGSGKMPGDAEGVVGPEAGREQI